MENLGPGRPAGPLPLIGGIYINYLGFMMTSNLIAFDVLALFFPLWIFSQNELYAARKCWAGVEKKVETV